MKRLLILALLFVSVAGVQATVTINLSAGTLHNADGTNQPSGMLVQLVASTLDNTFSPVTPGNYTGASGDDQVLYSFSTDTNGQVFAALVITLAGNLNQGDLLMLRWFPTTAGPLNPSTTLPGGPAAGAPYGQFRTDIVENFSTIAWVMPADGSTVDLNFLTQSFFGTHPESDAFANLTVMAIPEPSSYALLVVGVTGLVFAGRRAKRLV